MGNFKDLVNALRKPFAAAPANVDATLRWFGKLPSYADYLVPAEQPPWAREFDEWLIAGAARYHELPQHSNGSKMPESRGVLRLAKSGVAVCYAHSDHGGDSRGRDFGFCFFCGAADQGLASPSAAVADNLAAIGLLGSAQRELRETAKTSTEISGHFSSLGRRGGRAASAPMAERLQTVVWDEWFEEVRSQVDAGSAAEWVGRLSQFGRTIAASDGAKFETHVRFPISATREWEAQAFGWAKWLEQRLREPARAWSWVCATPAANQAPASWTVLGRAVLAEDYLLLTPAAEALAYIDHAGRSVAAPTADATAAVGTSPGTWHEWLERPVD